MRGLTGVVFRNQYAQHFEGIDWAVTPFLTTFQGARFKPNQLQEVLPENNQNMRVVPQILGKTADQFVSLAKILFDLGYDTVNWNLGCPFPRVAHKQRGSGLLPHPDLIAEFLDETIPLLPTQLSIKMRLGRHRSEEIFELLPVFNKYPIKELIIHPRTGVQMYTGRTDLDTFEKCLPLVRCAVIYNGDINTRQDYQMLRERFPGIATWMIGRGALSNPFLPAAIKGLSPDGISRVDRFRRFHEALYEDFSQIRHGPAHLVDGMKGYWTYFAGAFPEGERILKKIRKARTPEEYRAWVEYLLDNTEPEKSFVS